MADIDLLIAMQGDGKIKGQLAAVQQTAQRFRTGMVQAGMAMQGFDSAMNELNKTGKVSQATISQLTLLLPLLANPVTAVAVGIGAIVSQIMRWKAEQTELANALTDQRVRIYLTEAEKMVNVKTRIAGTSGREREILHGLADQQNLATEGARNYAETLKALGEEEKRTGESQNAAMSQTTENYVRSAAAIEGRKKALEEDLEALRKAIAAEKKAAEESRRHELALTLAGANEPFQRGAFESQELSIINTVLEHQQIMRAALIAEMNKQVTAGEKVTQAQFDELSAIDAKTAALERQADTYKFVAGVAKDAVGGIMAGAFNAYADALDETVSLNAIFAGGFDRALRNQAAAVVRSVGQQAAVRSIFELAEGFAALGSPFTAPFAPFHFKAAALFGGIALAAGPGAGLLSVAPAAAGSAGGRGGKGGSGDSGSARSGATINVTILGAPSWETKRSIKEWVSEVESEGG